MTLENRVSKLEAKLNPVTPDRTTIYLLWITRTDDDNYWRRLQHGDQIWHRQDNESEDDFKARAIRDTDMSQPVTLFFVNS